MAKGLFNDGYRKDAVVIGLEVLSDEENDIYVPEAEYLLSEALYTYDSDKTIVPFFTANHYQLSFEVVV